jgi:hypothetical protein
MNDYEFINIIESAAVNNHQLKAGGIKTGGLNRKLKENTAESRWF